MPVKTWKLSCLYFTLMTTERGVILLMPRLVYHGTSVIPLSSDEPAHLVVSWKTTDTENISILGLPRDWSWKIYLVYEWRFHFFFQSIHWFWLIAALIWTCVWKISSIFCSEVYLTNTTIPCLMWRKGNRSIYQNEDTSTLSN